MQLAYVILLPDEVHNLMRRVQAELYERYEASLATLALGPHITVKQPFEAEELDRYERFLDRLAAETDPFEIVMRGFGFFERAGSSSSTWSRTNRCSRSSTKCPKTSSQRAAAGAVKTQSDRSGAAILGRRTPNADGFDCAARSRLGSRSSGQRRKR